MKPKIMLGGLLIFGICTIDAWAEGDALKTNREKWRTAHIRSYVYGYRRSCVCQAENQAFFSISIVDGAVDEVVYMQPDSGSRIPIAKEKQHWYPTIDDLFDRLAEARAMGAPRIEATYDARYGYPVRIHIDYNPTLSDDELDVQVTDFQVTE